jgi:acyl transferase domain-containing protein
LSCASRLCPQIPGLAAPLGMTILSIETTNGKVAFLFPGQGSQAVGMGKELAEKFPIAKRTFEEADEALGYKLSCVCFD